MALTLAAGAQGPGAKVKQICCREWSRSNVATSPTTTREPFSGSAVRREVRWPLLGERLRALPTLVGVGKELEPVERKVG